MEIEKRDLYRIYFSFLTGVILFSLTLIILEVASFNSFCKEIEGDFEFKNFNFYCNDEIINKYYDSITDEKYFGFEPREETFNYTFSELP